MMGLGSPPGEAAAGFQQWVLRRALLAPSRGDYTFILPTVLHNLIHIFKINPQNYA